MAATQNTLIVINDTTISTSIKPALLHELSEVSKVTGRSLSRLLNRAIDSFMEVEALVLMDEADNKTYAKKGQPIPVPAGFRSNGDGTISNLAFPPVHAKAKRQRQKA